jgi:uncharacterized glyoxalase superfamily protein PhnB
MAESSTPPAQRVFPYLYVDDVGAYLAFLSEAFGFRTRSHHVDPHDAHHVHAEAALGDVVVMVGRASPKWGTVSARGLPGVHAGVFVYVDDVDEHCRRARAAGAVVDAPPEDKDWGDRMYSARDCERNQWYFATQRRASR